MLQLNCLDGPFYCQREIACRSSLIADLAVDKSTISIDVDKEGAAMLMTIIGMVDMKLVNPCPVCFLDPDIYKLAEYFQLDDICELIANTVKNTPNCNVELAELIDRCMAGSSAESSAENSAESSDEFSADDYDREWIDDYLNTVGLWDPKIMQNITELKVRGIFARNAANVPREELNAYKIFYDWWTKYFPSWEFSAKELFFEIDHVILRNLKYRTMPEYESVQIAIREGKWNELDPIYTK